MHDRAILDLTEPAARDRTLSGSKAAVLAALAQAGFRVPDGCVLTIEAFAAPADAEPCPGDSGIPWAAVREAARRYDGIAVAVRSSGLAEDLPGASFAGLYETVLDVQGLDDLADAVRRCRTSAQAIGVREYRVGVGGHRDVAVLIQRLIRPSVAGVAFGADPMTGNRATVLVSAVRGSGAPLVAGLAEGEDWEVTGHTTTCRGDGSVLRPAEARSVADLLRQAEDLLGGPLDMEWALADGTLWVLQARPMTAVPPEASWTAPLPGGWFRSIRLGEWLPEPVTPLCDTWLLARMEDRFRHRQEAEGGIKVPPPLHVLVEGWYFHSPIGTGGSLKLLAGLARKPRLAVATVVGTRRPVLADRLYFGARAQNWRSEVLRPYQIEVGNAWQRVEHATPTELMTIASQVADTAGGFLWSLVTLGGAAWRSEVALARFHHRHLTFTGVPYQALLGGLTPPPTLSHAVQSLDWFRPTLAELAGDDPPQRHSKRLEKVTVDRIAAEQACRDVLAGASQRCVARFESLLDAARRYAIIRWELSDWFTYAWPLLRRCTLRLGEAVYTNGQIGHPDDVFFLTFPELEASLAGIPPPGLRAATRRRRSIWERQRQLAAPLSIGRSPFLLSWFLLSTPKFLQAARQVDGELRGIPASPGSATGPVKVVRNLSSAAAAEAGDVLVVPAIVPALTPLFGRIAAICADSGSVAAHTSIVAREYGIPSVTGLGVATRQLTDGILVTVDGTAGRVVIR